MATHFSILAWRSPIDRGAWGATVHGIARSRARLSDQAQYTYITTQPQIQAMLQQYVNRELLDIKTGFRKGRRTRDQIAKIFWITEKARRVQKNIYFSFIDFMKAFDCMVQQIVGNYSRDGNTLSPYLSPEKPVCRTRSNS